MTRLPGRLGRAVVDVFQGLDAIDLASSKRSALENFFHVCERCGSSVTNSARRALFWPLKINVYVVVLDKSEYTAR